MPTSVLATICAPPASSTDQVVRERLARLAELIRKDGAPYPLTGPLVNVWVDVFARSDLIAVQVHAAFDKAERQCKFWPSPAEVLGFVLIVEGNAAEEEAAHKFERVLAYAVRQSPDIPDRNPPHISERTRRAINAAGGLNYLSNCDRESLHWARKCFIEAFLRYGELQLDEHLLPAGQVRELLEARAELKLLPSADAYTASRAIGESYRKRLGHNGAEVSRLPPLRAETKPCLAIATAERSELLERQRAEILARSNPDEIRKAEQLRARCKRGAP